MISGRSLDPLSLLDDGLSPSEVGVAGSRRSGSRDRAGDCNARQKASIWASRRWDFAELIPQGINCK